MRKVIGIGETILDIIFRNDQPSAAVPGGSVFNAIVSLARLGVPVSFISETGGDHVGDLIKRYMVENGIATDYLDTYNDNKSPISLAFLNSESDAQYSFYKAYPEQRLHIELPQVNADDIIIIGSYYAVTPALRNKHLELLDMARERQAIVFYDLNFRKPHKSEAIKLTQYFLENFEYASIIRGSEDDFMCLYELNDPDKVYLDKIKFYCPNFVYTAGHKDVALRTSTLSKSYAVQPMTPVSTVGAGDNFNAGLIYGILQQGIGHNDLANMTASQWDALMGYAMRFSAHVCGSFSNSISTEFAQQIKSGK